MGELSVESILDIERLQRVQDSFAEATDLAIIAVDSRGTPVTSGTKFTDFCAQMRADPVRRRLCYGCDAHGGLQAAIDGKPHVYRCHAGLVDFSVPIIRDETYIGAILCGQVRLSQRNDEPDFLTAGDDSWRSNPRLLPLFESVPVTSMRKIRAAAETLFELGAEITDSLGRRRTPGLPSQPEPAAGPRSVTMIDREPVLADQLRDALEHDDLTAAVDLVSARANVAFAGGSSHRRNAEVAGLEDTIVELSAEHAPGARSELQQAVARRRTRRGPGSDRYRVQLHLESLLYNLFDAADTVSGHTSMIPDLLNHLARHPDRAISLHEAASHASVSISHLSKRFKAETGTNYVAYVTTRRIQRAKMMLLLTEMPIVRIAIELDFNQVNYFSRVFKAYVGVPPSEFRRARPGESGRQDDAEVPGRDRDLLRA